MPMTPFCFCITNKQSCFSRTSESNLIFSPPMPSVFVRCGVTKFIVQSLLLNIALPITSDHHSEAQPFFITASKRSIFSYTAQKQSDTTQMIPCRARLNMTTDKLHCCVVDLTYSVGYLMHLACQSVLRDTKMFIH